MNWRSVGKRSERLIVRFLLFLAIGYFAGVSVVDDPTYFDVLEVSVDTPCRKLSSSHTRSKKYKAKDKSIYVGIFSSHALNKEKLQALEEQLRNLEDFNCGLFTPARQDNAFENLSRKYGVDIMYLDTNQPFETKAQTGYNIIMALLKHKFASYDWFVLLRENSHVNYHKLYQLLSRRNPDEPHYIGRSSRHTETMRQTGDIYCLEKPGLILSVALLRQIGGHLRDCLGMSYSDRFDLELGRCIKKYTGVACADLGGNHYHDDAISFFDVNQAKPEGFHPNHYYSFLQQRLNILQERVASRINRIVAMEVEIKAAFYKEIGKQLDVYKSGVGNDLIWDFTDWTSSFQQQREQIHPNFRSMIVKDLQKSIGEISKKNSILRKMNIDEYVALESSYIIKPLVSVDFQSRIRIAGNLHDKPVAIRLKNVHFRRQFTATYTFLTEDSDLRNIEVLNSHKLITKRSISERINFIVPVNGYGTLDYYKRFLINFMTEFCNKNENVSITVIYFPAKILSAMEDSSIDQKIPLMERDDVSKAKAELDRIKTFCPQQKMQFITVANRRPFSRGLALQIGAERTRNENSVDELLFFCDVTIEFKRNITSTIRRNTVRGQQVFYPIIFSQYNPLRTFGINKEWNVCDRTDSFTLDEKCGYWSFSNYGVLSIYKTDFMSTEGFDLSRRGWGIEEEKFCDAVMRKAKLKVFRSNEPNLFHLYHKKTCSPNQQDECKLRNAKYSCSQLALYNLWIASDHRTN